MTYDGHSNRHLSTVQNGCRMYCRPGRKCFPTLLQIAMSQNEHDEHLNSLNSFPALLPQTLAQPSLQPQTFLCFSWLSSHPCKSCADFGILVTMAAAWHWIVKYHQSGMACVSSNGTERCETWYIKGSCFLCPQGAISCN